MSRVVHFEIHADDPTRAARFYQELLGWQFTKWDGPMEYWMVVTGPDSQPGINGGLMRREGAPPIPGQPVSAYVCTVTVADLDATIAKGQSLGATLAVPRMAILGMGWLAYLTDTEGNLIGIMQDDPNAK